HAYNVFQPAVEPLQSRLTVLDWGVAMRTHVVTQPHHVCGFALYVFVDVPDKGHLDVIRYPWLKIDCQFCSAFIALGHLQPDSFPRWSLEISGEAPQFVGVERRRMMQADDQCGVDLIQRTTKLVRDENCRIVLQLGPFAPEVRGKDEQCALIGAF